MHKVNECGGKVETDVKKFLCTNIVINNINVLLLCYEDTQVHRLTFDCDFRVGTRLQRVLKPMFMFDRLFCSADMYVVLRLCHTKALGISQRGSLRVCRVFQMTTRKATDVTNRVIHLSGQRWTIYLRNIDTNLTLFNFY